MKGPALVILVIVITACENHPLPHGAILGTWKSDAEKTLASMNATKGVTPEARAIFEDDFFGHLIVECKKDESRAINEKDEYDWGFEPYEVIEVGSRYVKVKEWSDLLQEYREYTLHLEKNCYYLLTSKFEFREYFCKYE